MIFLLLSSTFFNLDINRLLPEEVFFAHLIQLHINVSHRRSESGNHHVLQGVDSSVCDLNHLVQSDEGSLHSLKQYL